MSFSWQKPLSVITKPPFPGPMFIFVCQYHCCSIITPKLSFEIKSLIKLCFFRYILVTFQFLHTSKNPIPFPLVPMHVSYPRPVKAPITSIHTICFFCIPVDIHTLSCRITLLHDFYFFRIFQKISDFL